MDMTPQTWPEWYDGRHINEVLFCQQFLDKHPMKWVKVTQSSEKGSTIALILPKSTDY